MPRYIAHYNGWFFEWSTVVDAPVTKAMHREEFEQFYKEEYGNRGIEDLEARLSRAITFGCSAFDGHSLYELIKGNRAGPKETELSFEEILNQIGVKHER